MERVLKFNVHELLKLEECLAPSEITAIGAGVSLEQIPFDIPDNVLVLKIAEGLSRALDLPVKNTINNTEVSIVLTDHECWIFRERVDIFVQISGINVGLTIKMKIYEALLSMDLERAASELLNTVNLKEGKIVERNNFTLEEIKNVVEKQESSTNSQTEGDTENNTKPKTTRKTRKKIQSIPSLPRSDPENS